jgi:hypothetical protein
MKIINFKSLYFFFNLLILSICLLIVGSCKERRHGFIIKAYTDIHKRIVASNDKNNIFIADNASDFYSVMWYQTGNLSDSKLNSKNIAIDPNSNIFPKSVSFDNELLCLEKLDSNHTQLQLVLYSLKNSNYIDITFNEPSTKKGGAFSPSKSLFAFICDGALVLYNYRQKTYSNPIFPDGKLFIYLTWSTNGKFILLLDESRGVWRMNLEQNLIEKKLKIPGNNELNTIQITPIKETENDFLFISDAGTKNGFNQVFHYSEISGTKQLTFTDYDKALFERPTSIVNIEYRQNVEGYWQIGGKNKHDLSNRILKGVIYDYVENANNTIYVLHSSNDRPIQLTKISKTSLTEIHNPNQDYFKIKGPEIIRNKFGMYHLVFTASKNENKWILWLHGGPHEQVSIRYNHFFSTLLNNGYNIIALNYPGSTGIGNKYELINISEEDLIETQIKSILEDIKLIKNKSRIKCKLNLISISYGSILAHELSKSAPEEFLKLIDISGIHSDKTNPKIEKLFIYGDKDFILKNNNRKAFLNQFSLPKSTVILKSEGHYILKRTSFDIMLRSILSFLK